MCVSRTVACAALAVFVLVEADLVEVTYRNTTKSNDLSNAIDGFAGIIGRREPQSSRSYPSIATNNVAEIYPKKPIIERFPHAVLYGSTCGGSIISSTWVLTAAHCTLFSTGQHVLAGTNVTNNGSGVRRLVKRLVVHPRFSVGPYWLNVQEFNIKQISARYDFLLVELDEPLPLDGKKMAAVQLEERSKLPGGLDVMYAGFGAENHGETMRTSMHAMDLATMDDVVCARKFEQFDPQDMICTKGKAPKLDSACNGDSGSGLVADGRLIGVASWVEDDATTCRPGAVVVFSRVSAVRSWIKKVTGV